MVLHQKDFEIYWKTTQHEATQGTWRYHGHLTARPDTERFQAKMRTYLEDPKLQAKLYGAQKQGTKLRGKARKTDHQSPSKRIQKSSF
jgi:hypothetical protein